MIYLDGDEWGPSIILLNLFPTIYRDDMGCDLDKMDNGKERD